MRAVAILVAVLAIAGLAAGCTSVPETFTCTSDAACRAGGLAAHCERTGLCSVDDPSCPAGTRYHRSAGARANQCVPEYSCADHPDAALCEDFEGPLDQLAFTPVTGSIYELVEDQPHRGRRAFKLSIPETVVGSFTVSAILHAGLRDVLAQPSVWIRVWLLAPVAPLGSNGVSVFTIEENQQPFGGTRVMLYADKTVLRNTFSGGSREDLMAPAYARWSCYIVRIENAPLAGSTLTGSDVGRVALSGAVQPAMGLDQVALGPFVNNPSTKQPPLDVYYDDILVDTRPIGCDE